MEKLLAWYRANRRDLPWRRTRDPYRIWVSELMLQQTQVATVIPYYERFLERFPTVRDLARAPVTAVLDSWSGLGYYSRARNLHAAARIITRDHAGRLPAEPEALVELPGIGRYTAGAIASIAYGRATPVLDGNVQRVLCRWLGIREDPRTPAVQRRLWEEAAARVPANAPGDFNQALMELGATVCTPRSPDCAACPISAGCAARRAGLQEQIPPPRRPAARKKIRYLCGVIERADGAVLLARRPLMGLLPGLWELPGGEAAPRAPAAKTLARLLHERLGLRARPGKQRARVSQTLSHRELEIRAFDCALEKAAAPRPAWYTEARWVPKAKLASASLTAGMRKLAKECFVTTLLAMTAMTAGCATATGPAVEPAELRAAQEYYGAKAALHGYQRTLRVWEIGERLIRAIPAEDCPKKGLPFVGVLLDDFSDIPARAYGLPFSKAHPRKACIITGVLPGGPADLADVRAGDLLLRVNGEETRSARAVARALRVIKPGGTVRLALEREGAPLERDLAVGEKPYPVTFLVADEESVNAHASPGHVVVTAGLLRFAKSDDEVAVVMGHELAHLTRGHIAKGLAPNILATIGSMPGGAVGILLPGAGRAISDAVSAGVKGSFSRDFEREADAVGLGYVHRAGYEPRAGVDFWDRFATELPSSITGSFFKTHPTSPERLLRLKKLIDGLPTEGAGSASHRREPSPCRRPA